jgi:hypothetical protein
LIKLKERKDLDFTSTDPDMNEKLANELLKIKKVRLIQDKVRYETLAL